MNLSLFVLGLTVCLGGAACTGTVTGGGGGPVDEDDGAGGTAGRGGKGGQIGQGGDGQESVVESTRFARLSHKQWENTVRDLFELSAVPGITRSFTGDSTSGRFDNAGGALKVTDALFTDYQQAAEAMAEKIAADSAARGKLLPAGLPDASDLDGRARTIVKSFGKRAFRRPLSEGEVDRYAAIFKQGKAFYGQDDVTATGLRAVIEAMLQSPHFLYRVERGAEANRPTPVSGHELASRLSYALANTMPDDELFAAADAGKFDGDVDDVRAELRSHAVRLLSGAPGQTMIRDFHTQLLRLHTYDGIDKDKTKVPEFQSGIGADLREETLRFIANVTTAERGSVADLFSAPYTFVNRRTAPIYGVQGTFTDEFKKVDLNPDERAGLLTQAGFLAANAHRDEIDSIHRGVFVHLNVLCTDLPPPAQNVTPVPTSGGKTNRERVDKHTGFGTCGGSCHGGLINPAGFAFESYDAMGKFRKADNGVAVDSSGELDVGDPLLKWTSTVDFAKQVSTHPETHRCMTRAWLEYLYGRRPVEDDAYVVGKVAAQSLESEPIIDLVVDLVTRESFLFRAER